MKLAKYDRRSFIKGVGALAAFPALKWGEPYQAGDTNAMAKFGVKGSMVKLGDVAAASPVVVLLVCLVVVVAAVVYLVIRGLKQMMAQTKVCPGCGRPVSKDAHKCPYCGHDFDDPTKSDITGIIIIHHIEVKNPSGVEVGWFPVYDYWGYNFMGPMVSSMSSQQAFSDWLNNPDDPVYERGGEVHILDSTGAKGLLVNHKVEIKRV